MNKLISLVDSYKRIRSAWNRISIYIKLLFTVFMSVSMLFLMRTDTHYPLVPNAVALLTIALLGLLIAVRALFRDTERTRLTITVLVVAVVELVIMYATIYRLLLQINPRSFTVSSLSGLDALYYSTATFTGFETLQPLSAIAKWVIISQMMLTFFIGTFVMSIFVSFLLRRMGK